tara:strand:+ start:64585 stop:65148 length:564 start_codon:yes stop_codon:yes gene_type:complete
MKIYTKKGDKGYTQLLGGTRVTKNNKKLECYGTLDELNAFIGNLYDEDINKTQKNILLIVQNLIFNIGSCIAFDKKKNKIDLPEISNDDIHILESQIDNMEKKLSPLTNFILPSGHPNASKCHIARTVCRRAERTLVSLSEHEEINFLHLKFLNRLSDYLFVLARYILLEENKNATEWKKKFKNEDK